MPTRIIISLAVLLSLIAIAVFGAQYGQIKGTITDAETGDPIIGASVMVVGTSFGAQTDLDGKFMIARLEPGTYDLRITSVGFNTLEVTGVVVIADLTTDVSHALEKSVGEINKTITVKGKQDILDRYEVASKLSIGQERVAYCALPSSPAFPPAHGGTAIVNDEAFDAMFFKHHGVNPFVDTEDDHLSTFAVDVDDASFILTRSYLERAAIPPEDAVRTEEFVNHFNYDYPQPEGRAFSIKFDGAPSRFGADNVWLMRVGIQGKEVRPENRKPANLVFVVDISGSMAREDRLGLVRKALRMLLDELTGSDRVGIVVYGSTGRILLEPTSIEHRDKIAHAIDGLQPGGSTNAEQGLRLGYEMADRMFEKGKINRVILCSDGVANVGVTGPDGILKQIKKYADKGVTLSSIGFGMGNYNDLLLEKLGNKGNGFYAYVDDLEEARRIFVDNLTGTLQVIARDVKIQVDFDPEKVRSYRLLGYENRDVDDDKFRDDAEDGGEIGCGHTVTALYEIKLHDKKPRGDLGQMFIRFKDPDTEEVTEVAKKIDAEVFTGSFDEANTGLKLSAAAAEFAEILRGSYWAKDSDLADVLSLATEVYSETEDPDVLEMMMMISKSDKYQRQLAEK